MNKRIIFDNEATKGLPEEEMIEATKKRLAEERRIREIIQKHVKRIEIKLPIRKRKG